MSDTIISVENLGKRYRIVHEQGRPSYSAFRDVLASKLTVPLRAFRKDAGATTGKVEDFWALRNVSFDIKQGEVVGIIGRNGAGKSTLLKVLSRITEPTEGRVRLRGRMASLLEVGTGFHPELTGRENIFLNGAILGMSRGEVARKFDEIVAFAEVERFLDTPVKRYSSGMYVRLAFAVAAHIDPEILIVDEVLAVGDAAFQKKCLGKMREVASGGRTVLFVSHSMAAINRLCETGIVLDKGQVVFHGETGQAVSHYTAMAEPGGAAQSHVLFAPCRSINRETEAEITRVEVLGSTGVPKPIVRTWDDIVLRVHGWCNAPIAHGAVEIEVGSAIGDRLFRLSTQPDSNHPLSLPKRGWSIDCAIPSLPLAAGMYALAVSIARPNIEYVWRSETSIPFEVFPRDVFRSGVPPTVARAPVAVPHMWSFTADEKEAVEHTLVTAVRAGRS